MRWDVPLCYCRKGMGSSRQSLRRIRRGRRSRTYVPLKDVGGETLLRMLQQEGQRREQELRIALLVEN